MSKQLYQLFAVLAATTAIYMGAFAYNGLVVGSVKSTYAKGSWHELLTGREAQAMGVKSLLLMLALVGVFAYLVHLARSADE